MVDFGTFGANGAAKALDLSKQAVVLTKGTYTLEVTLKNEVSEEKFTKDVN